MKGNKIVLKFETISKVSISPRSSQALYAGVDYEKELEDDFSIIYPFYSYSSRHLMDKKYNELKDNILYYVPASSIKGALMLNEQFQKVISVNDVEIDPKDISLENVYKFQYVNPEIKNASDLQETKPVIEQIKSPKYDVFFPNVKIEMINREVGFSVNIMVANNSNQPLDSIDELLYQMHQYSMDKIKNYITKLELLINYYREFINNELIQEKAGFEQLVRAKESMKKLQNKYLASSEKRFLMFLGGFKGHLAANEKIKTEKIDEQFPQAALYFEKESLLPYGLVEVSIQKKD